MECSLSLQSFLTTTIFIINWNIVLSQMLNMLFINPKQQKYERNLAKPTSVQGNIHHHIVGAFMLMDPCFLCLFM